MSLFSFSERLRVAMDAAKMNQASLARKAGMTRSAVNQVLQGTSKGMKPENLVAVARALDVRVEWLATGEMPMRQEIISAQDREFLERLHAVPSERRKALLEIARQLSV